MIVSIRSLCLLGGLALLSACGGSQEADNLADLDARLTNGAGALDDANVAIALAAAGGKLEKAPVAIESKEAAPQGGSLGDILRRQALGKGGAAEDGSCMSNVKTGPEWADRMRPAFRLYPGGKLIKAAGIDAEHCTLRIISFTTTAGIDPILDYYYTMARRAGFDAEHLLSGNEHQLGGTSKDGGAYVVFARGAGDLTDVDVVAN